MKTKLSCLWGKNIFCVVFSDTFSVESLKSFNFLVTEVTVLFTFLYINIIKFYTLGSENLPAYQRRWIILITLEFYYLLSHLFIYWNLYLLEMPSSVSYPLSIILDTCAALTVCLCFSKLTQHAWKEAAPIVFSRVFWQREFPPCIKL